MTCFWLIMRASYSNFLIRQIYFRQLYRKRTQLYKNLKFICLSGLFFLFFVLPIIIKSFVILKASFGDAIIKITGGHPKNGRVTKMLAISKSISHKEIFLFTINRVKPFLICFDPSIRCHAEKTSIPRCNWWSSYRKDFLTTNKIFCIERGIYVFPSIYVNIKSGCSTKIFHTPLQIITSNFWYICAGFSWHPPNIRSQFGLRNLCKLNKGFSCKRISSIGFIKRSFCHNYPIFV